MTNPVGFSWSLRGNAAGVIDDIKSMVGGANDSSYRDLIMPPEIETDPKVRPEYVAAHCSGCGLVVRGYLRRLGCEDPILQAPFRNQHAISDLVAIDSSRGARYTAPFPVPDYGDVYRLGIEDHVGIALSATELDSENLMVESVDGGQGAGGLYVATVKRVWRKQGGQWWAHRGSDSRPVVAVYNLERLIP